MTNVKRATIVTAAVFLLLAGSVVNGQQLFYMAALLLALPAVSYAVGLFALRDIEFERETPESAWEGETVTFRLTVRSRSRLTRLYLQATDSLPEWLDHARGEPVLFNAPAMSEVTVEYPVYLGKRGAYVLDSLEITASDPLGMFSVVRRVPSRAEIVVYPFPEPVPEFVYNGADRFGVEEVLVTRARGSGIDPDGVREYQPGDPLNRVHWKSTARTGALNVIEFMEPHSLSVCLVLDLEQGTDVGRGKDTTLEYLVRAAASVAQEAVRMGATSRLVAGSYTTALAPGRGTEQLFRILGGLARARATDPRPLHDVLLELLGSLRPLGSLVVFTAKADPRIAETLSHVAARHASIGVVYADPRSFAPESRLTTEDERRRFLDALAAVRAQIVVVQRRDTGSAVASALRDARVHA
ncbi:MAG TPA: DUF58 domain-containing protein [Chthonomonadales bacterium]|nr:DUF58 domain-containing protein [Chthonomonadales bacterium]